MRRIEVQKDIRGAMQLLTQAADGDAAQRQNDTVIFEHYRPAPRWR